jgi:hypothetical protein
VGPLMRENRSRLRAKYEFADLQDYVTDEPTVNWNVRDVGVDLTLVYFCPVYERTQYRTDLVKRILEKFSDSPKIHISAPATTSVLTTPAVTIPTR